MADEGQDIGEGGDGLGMLGGLAGAEGTRPAQMVGNQDEPAERPSRTGVVRAMAAADHWRRVSTPKWVRTSWKVTSTCQHCR